MKNIFTWIDDVQARNIIRDYSPIMEDSIKEYIMSENTNFLLKAKTVGYMATGSIRKILPSFLFKEQQIFYLSSPLDARSYLISMPI